MRVRAMEPGDLVAVTGLCGQLGYPATEEQMRQRVEVITADPDAALLVAESDGGSVAGWIYVRGVRMLQHDPCAEIWGLVVDDATRRQGIGRALIAAAESWAREHGYTHLRLRSNIVRAEAHRFYQGLDYAITKTSYLFEKDLAARTEEA